MKKKMSPGWTVFLGFGISALACLMTLMLQTGSLTNTLKCNFDAPVLLLLNWLPMAVMLLVLYCLLGNIFFSGSLTTLFWGILSFINLVKTQARGDPFVPSDVLLLFEGIEAVGNYQLQLHPGKLVMLIATCVVLWVLGIFLKSPNMRWRVRIAAIVAAIAVFAGAMAGLYTNNDLYERIPGPTRSNVPAVFDSFGFPYAFLHNFNLYPVDKPEGYSQAEAEQYEDLYLQKEITPDVAPNIIMIMCEAFTDLPNEDVFNYSTEENPIAFYNSLAARDDTISGKMIVSNTGAGTANTEFDVLTGMMTNRIGAGTTSAFRVIHRSIDSIPWMLSNAGYHTFFTHPGHNWFYNRESVYSYLGITDQVFNDVYSQDDYKGSWISDDAFLQVLTKNLEEREGDAPLFTYGVTIQNHQAYTQDKYGFLPEPVQTDVELSAEASEYLSVYFEGLRDSDAMLRALTEYLQTKDEPYLLVFFGDHQPNLGPDYQSYRELGVYPENLDSAENRLELYSVPYLIWGNSAYHASAELPQLEQTTISSHYLGAMTCQIAGFSGQDGYIDYLNQLRQELPVSSVYGYMTADGTYLEELPEDLAQKEELRWYWQYYRLKHQITE